MFFYSQTKNEMSAQHAGTRKWQKIINHEKDSTNIATITSANNNFIDSNTNSSNDFNQFSSSNNFKNSSFYQVFENLQICVSICSL